MRLHCEFSSAVARMELEDYVLNMEISVACYDKDCVNEYRVACLAMDQILWADAVIDGESLFEICDNDSQGLHEVHAILTKGGQEFRPDLKITEATNHVMFLHGAVFHPSVHAYCQKGFNSFLDKTAIIGRSGAAKGTVPL